MWNLLAYSGYIATATGAITLIPEVMKALKTHHLKDVSMVMLILMLASSGLWLYYGILLHDLALSFSPIFNISLEIILIMLKKHYDRHGHPVTHPHFANCPGIFKQTKRQEGAT